MNSKDKEQPKKGIQTRGKGKTKAVCKPCAEGKSGGEKAYETDVPTDGVARTGDTVREYASDAASGGLAARPNTPIVSRAIRPNTLDLPHPNTQAIQTAPVAQRRSKLTEKSRASTLGASARSVCDREADVESVTSQSRTIYLILVCLDDDEHLAFLIRRQFQVICKLGVECHPLKLCYDRANALNLLHLFG